MGLLRGSTRAGRFLSGAANWESRPPPRTIPPRIILPATWPPIPNLALPHRLANIASSLGGRALPVLAVPTGGDVPVGRPAPKRSGSAGCALQPGRRRVRAFYPALFERFAYVESIPQYSPHRRRFKALIIRVMRREYGDRKLGGPIRRLRDSCDPARRHEERNSRPKPSRNTCQVHSRRVRAYTKVSPINSPQPICVQQLAILKQPRTAIFDVQLYKTFYVEHFVKDTGGSGSPQPEATAAW